MLLEIPEEELQAIIFGLGSALEAMATESAERTALRGLLRRLTFDRGQQDGIDARTDSVCGLSGANVDNQSSSGGVGAGGDATSLGHVMAANVSPVRK